MTRIKFVEKTFFASNRVMILVVIFAALLEHCLASSLGSKCQHDMDCTDFIKGSTCSMNGFCECAPYFVQYNVTTCLSSQLLGGDCILADQCTMKVANSSCLDGACRCVEGFLQFRKHTCLGPAHPGAVCYSHAHCQMNDIRSHCDFLIPNLFGRCQCTSPAKQYGGMCIGDDSSIEAEAASSQTTTYTPSITPPPSVFRPIDLISHYEISTQAKPLLINNNEIINMASSTENKLEFTKLSDTEPITSSTEQAGGEDLTADTEALDVLNNFHITSSTQGLGLDVAQQPVTSDDYPYKIDNEDQPSVTEEEIDQLQENHTSAEESPVAQQNPDTSDIKLDEEVLVEKETYHEQTPESVEQSEIPSEIQSSSEINSVPNLDMQSIENQHVTQEDGSHQEEVQPEQESNTQISPENELKPEEELHSEQEPATEMPTEIDHIPEITQQQNGAESEEGAATDPVEITSIVSEQVEEHKDEYEDKVELQDNTSQSEESGSSVEHSQESASFAEHEKEEEAPTEQPIEAVNEEIPDSNAEMSIPESPNEGTVFSEELLSPISKDPAESPNLELQHIDGDHTDQNGFESEQEPTETDKVPGEEQIDSEGGQLEESHYRPSSDVHDQDDSTVTETQPESHVDNNAEMTSGTSQENKEDISAVQGEMHTDNADKSQSSNVEKENENPELNYELSQNAENNLEQADKESEENPILTEEAIQTTLEQQVPEEINSEQSIQQEFETTQKENIEDQVDQETNAQQVIEDEQEMPQEINSDEQKPVPQEIIPEQLAEEENSSAHESLETTTDLPIEGDIQLEDEEKNKEKEESSHSVETQDVNYNEVETNPEPVVPDVLQFHNELISDSVDETKPSIVEDSTPADEIISDEIKEGPAPEIIEETHQIASGEKLENNKLDQEENYAETIQSTDVYEVEPHKDHTETQEPDHKISEAVQQELPQEGPNTAVQETIEELLQEAAQALAEKDTEEVDQEQNKEELQSVTDKPVFESEEQDLQSLQEEVQQQSHADELISLSGDQSQSVQSEEKNQENGDSAAQSFEEQSETETEQVSETSQADTTEVEDSLPEKKNPISLEEVQAQTLPVEPAKENNLQNEPQSEELHNNVQALDSDILQTPLEKEEVEAEHATESTKNEQQELMSNPDKVDENVSHENKFIPSEPEAPVTPEIQVETNELTSLENESSSEDNQKIHDLENIIEGAEPSNIADDNNLLNTPEPQPSETLTPQTNEGDETLAQDENPISSDENAISESNEKTESEIQLGTHPETKPIDEVKEIETEEEELLENDQATTVRSESEQDSNHDSPVHPTFELEETQQVVQNVNDNKPTDIEEANETQSGANANESEPVANEYVPPVTAESETLATPVAGDGADGVEPEISENENFEQFEDHHLVNEPSAFDDTNEETLSEESAASTGTPLQLESSPIIEENIENDSKASGDSAFNENESVLSILSGLIENEEEGSGTPLPEISIDDLKGEETVQNEHTPADGSYYPSILSDLVMSTKSEEDLTNSNPTPSAILNDNQESVTSEELPFDLSFVSTSGHEELMSDNLVVETTPSTVAEDTSEENIPTEVPDILEITTQTMLGLASRVTLMEPAAPVATTLKPFMSIEDDFSTTSSSLSIDPLITSKPVRKRVELGNGPVSLGLNCNNDKQCQLADPNTICSDEGICDCASKIPAKCSAERTGCSRGTFQCRSSGVCISWFFVCDGRPDCTDASDEECTFNARLNQTCPKESFRCEHSGRCISRAALCDGRKQCPHGEDETECDSLRTEGGQCPPNTFRCNSGECLPEYEYCNAIISCKDASDEPPHLCGSRSVPNIFLRLLTAAVVDDNSGKSSRVGGGINAYCPHRCSNGRCRSTAIVCSGRDGCGDGTDEETCSVCRCPAPAHANASADFLAQQPPMPLWK